MESDVRTLRTVSRRDSLRERLSYLLLVRWPRMAITGGLVAVVVLIVLGLIYGGVLAVGPGSSVSTLFGSGLTSGIVTLTTVALSINQLILSRVFGSPNELSDRLDGTRDLRETIEQIAEVPSTPNDPVAFLSLIAVTLSGRASAALTALEAADWESSEEVAAAMRDIVAYGRRIDDHLEEQTEFVAVLDVLLGPEYARNMTAVHHLRSQHEEFLSDDASTNIEAVENLLESLAVTRQFFKTIALQRDFARLSRIVAYSGLVALLVTVSLALLYRSSSVTVPVTALPAVVSVGVGAVFFPLAVFVSYMIRAATVAHRTVSVGPFIPP